MIEKEQPTRRSAILSTTRGPDEPRLSNSPPSKSNGVGQHDEKGPLLQQADSFDNNCTCDIKLDKRKSNTQTLTQALDDVLDDIDKNYGPMDSKPGKGHTGTVRFSLSGSPDLEPCVYMDKQCKTSPKSKKDALKEYEAQLGKSYRSFNEDVDRSIDKDLNIKPVNHKPLMSAPPPMHEEAQSLPPSKSTPTSTPHDGLIMIHPSHTHNQNIHSETPQLERQLGFYKGEAPQSVPNGAAPPSYDDVDRTNIASSAYEQTSEEHKVDSISADHDVVHPDAGRDMPSSVTSHSQPRSTIPPPQRPEVKPGMTSIGVQYSPPLTPVASRHVTAVNPRKPEVSEPKRPQQVQPDSQPQSHPEPEPQSQAHPLKQQPHHSHQHSKQHQPHQQHHHHNPQPILKHITSRPPPGPPGQTRTPGPQISRPPRLWAQGAQAIMEQRAAAAAAGSEVGTSENPSAAQGADTPEISLSKISLYDNVVYSPYEAAAIARAASVKKDFQTFQF